MNLLKSYPGLNIVELPKRVDQMARTQQEKDVNGTGENESENNSDNDSASDKNPNDMPLEKGTSMAVARTDSVSDLGSDDDAVDLTLAHTNRVMPRHH